MKTEAEIRAEMRALKRQAKSMETTLNRFSTVWMIRIGQIEALKWVLDSKTKQPHNVVSG